MDKKQIILIYSGGMDSTTLLYYLKDKGYEVQCISFDYGQKHKKELGIAEFLCLDIVKVKHDIIPMSFLGKYLKSALTQKDQEIPEGHYAEESMKATIVPHRNLMMLTIANAIGISRGIEKIAFASHSGDHAIYPDCREEFRLEAEKALMASMDSFGIQIINPFMDIDKTDILRIGLNLKVPYQNTWSCYKGDLKACGKCGTCTERLEAFEQCETTDPLEYDK